MNVKGLGVLLLAMACSSKAEHASDSVATGGGTPAPENIGGSTSTSSSDGGAGMSGGASPQTCMPGETQLCVGAGQCGGAQICLANGSSWGPCDCGPNSQGTGGSGGQGSSTTGGGTSTPCDSFSVPQANGSLRVTPGYNAARDIAAPRVTQADLQGYGYIGMNDAAGSGGCMIPVCSKAGCTPAFGATALCTAGIVTPNPTSIMAELGITLNQKTTDATPDTIDAPASITVSATIGTGLGDPYVGGLLIGAVMGGYSKLYCVLPGKWTPGVPIPISDFQAGCMSSYDRLAMGVPLMTIGLAVWSDPDNTHPFSICLTGVTFN